MRIADIRIGNRHRRHLGNIADLAASIAEIGLLHPVVVTPDGTLIAGARRIAACVSLGRTEIPVTVVDIPAIVRGEYAENTCRKDFAPSEAVAIWQAMESYQLQGKPLPESVIGLAQRGQGRSDSDRGNQRRDRAAQAVGVSHDTLSRAKAVLDAAQPPWYNEAAGGCLRGFFISWATGCKGSLQQVTAQQPVARLIGGGMDNPYQLLPDLTPEEYEALRESIRADGVKVPIEYDEDGVILDGHHRLRACRELGITEWPRVVRLGMSEKQKTEHVLALNLARRHLSREQRLELEARLRGMGMSTRTIADKLGISHETVRTDLAGVNFLTPEVITGSDGKHYPAQRSPDYDFVREQILEANRQGAAIPVPPAKHVAHVAHNSGENEWYTPPSFVEASRRTMGSIDLDPASSELANKTVKATVYYTSEDDGLIQEWYGNIWMNPPYSQPLIAQFSNMVADKYDCGDIDQACVLVNNATETSAFQRMLESCACVCFLKTRVKFVDMNGVASGAPLQGQAILYFGKKPDAFCKEFSDMGRILHAR